MMKVISATSGRRFSSEIDGRLVLRQRFRLAMAYLNPLRTLINQGFATRKKGKTAFGRAMSYALRAAVQGEYPNQYIEPAAVRLSEGVLSRPDRWTVTRQGRTIEVVAVSDPPTANDNNRSWDDRLVLCAYHPIKQIAGINATPSTREEGRISLELPSALADQRVHLYLMAHDRAGRKWSNSCYLGEY